MRRLCIPMARGLPCWVGYIVEVSFLSEVRVGIALYHSTRLVNAHNFVQSGINHAFIRLTFLPLIMYFEKMNSPFEISYLEGQATLIFCSFCGHHPPRESSTADDVTRCAIGLVDSFTIIV